MPITSQDVARLAQVTPSRVSQVVSELNMMPRPARVGRAYQFNAAQVRKIMRKIKRTRNGGGK